jgi:hypothetical protein
MVSKRERSDHEIAVAECWDVGAGLLDDADELVADRRWFERGVAAVVPEIGSALAREHDPDDGIGGLPDRGVGPGAGGDVARFVEDRSAHEMTPPQLGFGVVTCATLTCETRSWEALRKGY